MATQPFRQFTRLLRARLHLFQRRASSLTGGQFTLDALQLRLRLLATCLDLRQFLLQLLQLILITGQFLAQQAELFFLLGKIRFIRRIATAGFFAQTLTTQRDGLQGALGVRLVGQLDFQLLLTVGRSRLQALQLFLCLYVVFLDLRRDVHLLM